MPRTFDRRVGALLLTLVLALAFTACGDDDDGGSSANTGGGSSAAEIPAKPESGTFRMGIQPWLGYGPWYVAQEKGFFEKHGLDVEITNFTTDDQINAAFAGRKLDGTNIATHSALRFRAQGLPVKLVLLEDVSTTADAILTGGDIGSIEDLRGKRVGYEEGTTSDILLSYALSESGMSKDDVESVPIAAADAGAAFIADRVPAAVTYEPYLTTATKRDKGAKLLYTAGENPGIISDALLVSEDTIEKKPGQVAALVRAWDDAIAFYRESPKEAQAIIAKAVGAEPAELESAFEGVEFYDRAENAEQLAGDFANKTVGEVAKAAKDAGLLEDDVDTDSLIDARFVAAG